MGRGAQGIVTFAPVGDSLDNGFELGGSRIYPFSSGLALSPPAYYSDFIGTGTGLPVSVPAASLPSTSGAASGSTHAAVAEAAAHPFGRTSPLPWVIAGLFGGVAALYAVHYKKGGD